MLMLYCGIMKKSTKKDKRPHTKYKQNLWSIIIKYSNYLKILITNNSFLSLIFFAQMLWTFPQPVMMQASGLDPSWVNALYMMVLSKMQFGSDVIFTFGPLGFLSYPMLIDYNLWRITLLFQILTHILLYLTVFILLRKISAKWYHYLFMLPILLFANLSTDELLPILTSIMLFISFISDVGDKSQKKNYDNYIWLTLSGLLIAISSLLKFNSLLVSLSLIAVSIIIFILLKKDYKSITYLISCTILFFIIFWSATGQNFANVPNYIFYGAELSRGYTSAMSLESPFSGSGQFIIFLISIICVFCLLAYSFIKRKSNIFIFLILNLVLLFASYKHGFVRHDLHVLSFFLMYILVLGILFVMVSIELQKKIDYLCIFCFAMTLIVIIMLISTTNAIAPWVMSENILTRWDSYSLTGKLLLNQSAFDAIVDTEKQTIKNSYVIDDQTLKNIDNKSIDIFPWDISLCWAYGLNWSPKFVIQSYLDYTADLDNATSQHFIDKNPPQFIMYSYKSIDGRYPLFDEPSTFRAILNHYDYAQISSEFIILNRSVHGEKYSQSEDLGTVVGKMGQEIPVPDYNGLVFGSVHVNYNINGKLMDMLYKPSELYIQFKYRNGDLSGIYRFIPNDASNGLLLSHYVGGEKDLTELFQGDITNDIEGFFIYAGNPSHYESDIKVNYVGYTKR